MDTHVHPIFFSCCLKGDGEERKGEGGNGKEVLSYQTSHSQGTWSKAVESGVRRRISTRLTPFHLGRSKSQGEEGVSPSQHPHTSHHYNNMDDNNQKSLIIST